jgi:ribosomal protein L3 glutamine methyltransferase
VRRIIDNAGRHLTVDAELLCEAGRDQEILETIYPDTRFLWLDSEESAGEAFWLDAAQCARAVAACRAETHRIRGGRQT